jgi:cytochrome c
MKISRSSAGACALVLACATAHAQDASAGKAVFAQCTACHSLDGKNGVGPSLRGVVGRTAGTATGFHYSSAMLKSGATWDAKSLDRFIANPQQALPGNAMPFAGLPDAKQRADLLAFLKTLT